MRAQPDILAAGGFFGGHCRVIVENAVTSRVRGDGVEVFFREIECESEDPDEPSRQFEAFLPVCDAAVLESWEVRGALPDVVFSADEGLDFWWDGGGIFWVGIVLRFVAPAE